MPSKEVQAENKPLEQTSDKSSLRTQQETRMHHRGSMLAS